MPTRTACREDTSFAHLSSLDALGLLARSGVTLGRLRTTSRRSNANAGADGLDG